MPEFPVFFLTDDDRITGARLSTQRTRLVQPLKLIERARNTLDARVHGLKSGFVQIDCI